MSAADDMDREDEATGAGAERPPAPEEAAGKESAEGQTAAGEPAQAASERPAGKLLPRRKRAARKAAAEKEAATEKDLASAQEPAAEEPAAEEPPAEEPAAAEEPVAEERPEAAGAKEAESAKEAEPAQDAEEAREADHPRVARASKPGTSGEQPAARRPERATQGPASPGRRGLPGRSKRGKRAPRRRVVRARARYVRTSARKARMVCGHLRGKSVQEARAILAFTPREVARDWSKLLESAVANAESNHELLEDDLIIREAYADEGPTIKRFRPRAMGRATAINKRTSHLTIALTTGPEQARTTKRRS